MGRGYDLVGASAGPIVAPVEPAVALRRVPRYDSRMRRPLALGLLAALALVSERIVTGTA